MRYVIICIFILTTGCLDMFFATPVDMSDSAAQWVEHKLPIPVSVTNYEMAAAFGNTGYLFLAYTTSLNGNLFVIRYLPENRSFSGIGDFPVVPTKDISMVVAPAADPADGIPYVAAVTNSSAIALFSWPAAGLTTNTIPNPAGYSNTALTISDSGTVCLAGSSGSVNEIWTNVAGSVFSSFHNFDLTIEIHSTSVIAKNETIYSFTGYQTARPDLYRIESDGGASGLGPSTMSSIAPVQSSACYTSKNDVIHAVFLSDYKLYYLHSVIDAGNWQEEIIVTANSNITDFTMVQNDTSGALYLVYSTTANRVGVLKYSFANRQWEEYLRESVGPVINGTFTAAVDPDDRLWLICTVEDADTPGQHSIVAYRSSN